MGQVSAAAVDTVQTMVDDMQRPQDLGGRMPVDTGTLRNSGAFSTPIIGWNPASGQSISWSWGANYAVVMNARTGFMDLVLQDFQGYASRAARRAR